MPDLLQLHAAGMLEFDRRVNAVRADQWHASTPCSEWDVRTLVNHLVGEQLWVPPLMAGQTIADVGDRFDGDQLGDDPVLAWKTASAEAREALTAPGALERTVHLSFGDTPATEYLGQLIDDLAIHSWDLARATGSDETLDPALVAAVYEHLEPMREELAGYGVFAPPVEVGEGADEQSRLLGMTGRRP